MATLNLSFTIPDAHAAQIRDDFCAYHNYQDTVNGQPNPENRNAFVKRKVGEFVKDSVKAYRANLDAAAARTSAAATVDANIVLS